MTMTVDSAPNTAAVQYLNVAQIEPSPLNPRKHFDAAALEELAASIRRDGLLQPIVVRPAGEHVIVEGGDRRWVDSYVIVAGERRWRAAKLADLSEIPALVREDLDDAQHLRLALVENLQRRDLDPIEEAEGYAQLNRVVGLRQAEIAAAVNRSQPAVANAMRLLDLPEDVRERIRGGELSVAHGVALASYKGFPAFIAKVAALAVSRRLPSKQLEGKAFLDEYSIVAGLLEAGVLQRVQAWEFGDLSVCRACPFQAYRAGSYGDGGYCLKPDHYAELKAEREAARAASVREALAVAPDESLPRMQDLDHKGYEQIWRDPPAGCTAACLCRAAALGYDGRPAPICTDPARFRELKAATAAFEKKAKKTAHKRRRQALAEAAPSPTAAGLALIAAAVLKSCRLAEVRAAAARHLPGLEVEKNSYADLTARLAELEGYGQDAAALIRACAEALVASELHEYYEGYGQGTPLADFYLGDGATPPEAAP